MGPDEDYLAGPFCIMPLPPRAAESQIFAAKELRTARICKKCLNWDWDKLS